MGPFSNNNSPQPPTAPSGGSKLPIPDVEGTPPPVITSSPELDNDGVKKWLNVTSIIIGVVAVAGIIVFGVYAYVSNTPGYVLSAAFQNFVNSEGQAGIFTYQTTRNGHTTSQLQGDFLGYGDPTNPHVDSLTLSVGQDTSRVSATARLFSDGNYLQTAGLANLGRLITSVHGNTSAFTPDNLVRLSSLDGQWYTLTNDDVRRTSSILPQHTLQSGPTSTDVEKLGQLYLQHQFITSAQQLGDQRIDNLDTMHLKIDFNQTKLNDFLQALKNARLTSLHLTDSDIQTIQKSQLLSSTAIEVWINRSDHTFEQVRLSRTDMILTITFQSEDVATQQQSVPRPDGAQSAAGFIQSLHDILTTRPAAR